MAYRFYLGGLRLPVPPSKMTLKVKNGNKTVNLIDDGEINILKTAGLSEVSFEMELPQSPVPYAEYPKNAPDAGKFLDRLEKLKTANRPFQLIVTRTSPAGKLLFDTSLSVSLEEYSVTEDAGDGLDLKVAVELKQYRPYHTKTLLVRTDGEEAVVEEAPPERPAAKETAKLYTVKKGDCLWTICKRELGDGSKCWEIAKRNGIKNPNLIYPGQVIRLD